MRTVVTKSKPCPPYSCGMKRPWIPKSAHCDHCFLQNRFPAMHSSVGTSHTERPNCSASFASCACSAVMLKSIVRVHSFLDQRIGPRGIANRPYLATDGG